MELFKKLSLWLASKAHPGCRVIVSCRRLSWSVVHEAKQDFKKRMAPGRIMQDFTRASLGEPIVTIEARFNRLQRELEDYIDSLGDGEDNEALVYDLREILYKSERD